MNLQLIQADAADRLLEDARFTAQWTELCANCPWTTGFQTPAFGRAWLSTYRSAYAPLFVIARQVNGSISGILPLALGNKRDLIPLGGLQAEYQGWICTPETANEFPWLAIQAARQHVPGARLTFRFLPAGTPLDWVHQDAPKRRTVLTSRQRPVQRLGDGSEVAASLRKSGNKGRLRQLKKLGDFSFERITDFSEFERTIDEILRLYDFRHGAVHGSAPVASSVTHRDFHLALMRSGLLHVTLMRTGKHLVSAHWGVRSRDELELGTIVYDPQLARSSPGKLHLLLLAQMLVDEGCATLDLTPGDEPYKARFATDWDLVHLLEVLPSTVARSVVAMKSACARPAKAVLRMLGKRPAQVQASLQALRRAPVPAVLQAGKEAAHWVAGKRMIRLLTADRQAIVRRTKADNPSQADPRRNQLDDLLSYLPPRGGMTRQAFLSDSLARFEDGQQSYTIVRNDRLDWLGWLGDAESERFLDEEVPDFRLAPGTAVLCDLHSWPDANMQDAESWAVATRMVSDAIAKPGVERIVAVLEEGSPLVSLLRELNFVEAGSLVRKTRLGRRRWRIDTDAGLLRAAGSVAPVDVSPEVELAASTPKKSKPARERDLTPAG